MRTRLNISQRWGAIALLASISEGTIKELRMVKSALRLLTISNKEKQEYGLEVLQGQIQWNKKTELKEKEFTFDDGLLSLMREKLTAMNDAGKIRSELYDIAEKLEIE